jgi:flagellin-specific chaperone FliS
MSSSIHAYRTVDSGTASSRSVVIRLYATAEARLTEAAERLARGEDATDPLHKAQAIVGGLLTGLDLEAGEMAQRFLNLYMFVLDRIESSHRETRDSDLGVAVQVLAKLREGFEQMPADEARKNARPLSTATVGLHLKG